MSSMSNIWSHECYESNSCCGYWCHHWPLFNEVMSITVTHNEHNGVSNHRGLDCLLKRCSGADQRNHQRSASRAFVRGIRRWPVDSLHIMERCSRKFVNKFIDNLSICTTFIQQTRLVTRGGTLIIQPTHKSYINTCTTRWFFLGCQTSI